MSVIDSSTGVTTRPAVADVTTGPAAGSLRERLAIQRRELERVRSQQITVPVNGYERDLAARYRRLTFEEKTKIAMRHEGVAEDAVQQVNAACDLLINACEELMEVTSDGQYRGLGVKWSTGAICDLFGVSLPDGTTARQAMLQTLDHEDLMDHFLAYVKQANSLDAQVVRELPGESVPSSERREG